MGSNYINTDFQFKSLLAAKAECMGGFCSCRCYQSKKPESQTPHLLEAVCTQRTCDINIPVSLHTDRSMTPSYPTASQAFFPGSKQEEKRFQVRFSAGWHIILSKGFTVPHCRDPPNMYSQVSRPALKSSNRTMPVSVQCHESQVFNIWERCLLRFKQCCALTRKSMPCLSPDSSQTCLLRVLPKASYTQGAYS